MARRRMIDPTIWEDEHFGILSDKAKILFISCISNADDDGRLSGNLNNLRAIAFRFEDISVQDVEKLITELSEKMTNFSYYDVKGCKYIQLKKWEEYQTQREERRKPSKLPTCQTDDRQKSDKSQRKLSKVKLSKDKIREEDFPFLLDTSFKQLYQDFLVMRSQKGKEATVRAQEFILTDLHKQNIKCAAAMLEQSIVNSWAGVFPLKTEKVIEQTQEVRSNKALEDMKRWKKEAKDNPTPPQELKELTKKIGNIG